MKWRFPTYRRVVELTTAEAAAADDEVEAELDAMWRELKRGKEGGMAV